MSLEEEASRAGRHDGWRHANFVDAYGEEPGRPEVSVPRRFAEAGLATYYLAGFEEGVSQYAEEGAAYL